MSDVLEFLLAHPEWQKKVKCVYSWAGVVGGSPLADNVYSSVRSWDFDKVLARVDEVLEWICPIINLRKGNSALSRIEEMDINANSEHRPQEAATGCGHRVHRLTGNKIWMRGRPKHLVCSVCERWPYAPL